METGSGAGGGKAASREVLRLREAESLSRSDGVPGREIANTVDARRITPPIREDHFVGLGLVLLIVG
jgi:hypothetical protein